jgi:hypothetical protein
LFICLDEKYWTFFSIKFSQLARKKFWTNRLVVGKSIVIKHPKDWVHNTTLGFQRFPLICFQIVLWLLLGFHNTKIYRHSFEVINKFFINWGCVFSMGVTKFTFLLFFRCRIVCTKKFSKRLIIYINYWNLLIENVQR